MCVCAASNIELGRKLYNELKSHYHPTTKESIEKILGIN